MSAASVATTAAVESATATSVEAAAATMKSSATVETSAGSAMEAATAVKAAGSAESAAVVHASARAGTESTAAEPAIKTAAEATIVEASSKTAIEAPPKTAVIEIVEATEAAIETTESESTEPGTGADEYAIGKPIGAVVAVRSAGIRIVVVVAVGAHRRSAEIRPAGTVADANADGYLRVRVSCGNHQNGEQSEVP